MCVLQHFRDTEITQLDGVARSEEHVLGFEISVKNLSSMDVLERHADLHEPLHDV